MNPKAFFLMLSTCCSLVINVCTRAVLEKSREDDCPSVVPQQRLLFLKEAPVAGALSGEAEAVSPPGVSCRRATSRSGLPLGAQLGTAWAGLN